MGDVVPPAFPPNHSHGGYAVITHSILTGIAFVVVVFRCAARLVSQGFLVDDYFMVVAMVRASRFLVQRRL